jgi:hypothetical protein
MKNTILIFAIFLSTTLYSQNPSEKDIKTFCNSFANTIVSGDLNNALNYFDPDYKRVQHDEYLAGNTKQFIQEFLAGYNNFCCFKRTMRTPSIDNIKSIKLVNIKYTDDQYIAKFKIELETGKPIKLSTTIVFKSEKEIYFVGAVG